MTKYNIKTERNQHETEIRKKISSLKLQEERKAQTVYLRGGGREGEIERQRQRQRETEKETERDRER